MNEWSADGGISAESSGGRGRGVACPICIKVLARGTRGRACLIFRDTPPHTHTPKTKSSLQRRRHTPRVCAGAGRAHPASRPGQRPTFLVRGFTDSLSLPHVTVRKGLCSGDGVTCVSRFRLIRSCWTRGKTLQSWVGGSSRGLPRLQVPGGASISRSPQPFTGSQDGAETFANNGKAVCRPASERVCFCLW